MIKKEIPDKIKIIVWQSIRSSIGVWDIARISIATAGSGLIFSAYGITLANSQYLGQSLTVFLSFILSVASLGLYYLIRRFTRSILLGIKSAESIEDSLFGHEESPLKITNILANKKHLMIPFLHDSFYLIWGAGLVFFSAILTVWRFIVWIKSF